ncbi:hypothetical protein LOTGIDRAFT_229657 [Lottia gigantea]|uniref:Peptidase S1 domain-containing protein n=1 Tax=Lottia gigantea TaxID=225164 RepID=V3ZIX3_LOTGI|nr:hypothetical protein LOTGIDRAFT_229657 [Lottia gigantea]ESO84197.1 hypothetical protein LOTGIDRAFT_229657 [Lottia gigantea]
MYGFLSYLFWLVVALSFICSKCLNEKLTRKRRVVGGAPLVPGEWPWLVSLHFRPTHPFTNRTKMRHLCTGALIDPQWVLTAGHCMDGNEFKGLNKKSNWVIVLGEYNQYRRESWEQRNRIKKYFKHPQYSARPLLRDLTLIKLKRRATINEKVKAINIDSTGECTVKGTPVSVAGWGQISYSPFGYGNFLPLKTSLSISNKTQCVENYSIVPDNDPDKAFYDPEDEGVLCAGASGGKDACLGDSGGPLACERGDEWKLTGVVSTGYDCGNATFPGLYTRVDLYSQWIRDTIANN